MIAPSFCFLNIDKCEREARIHKAALTLQLHLPIEWKGLEVTLRILEVKSAVLSADWPALKSVDADWAALKSAARAEVRRRWLARVEVSRRWLGCVEVSGLY